MLASLLLVPAAILFLLERRWVGRRLYPTVLGRGVRGERGPTPRGLRAFLVAFCSLVAIFVTLIYAGIVIGGLTRVWGADWHLTLRHWAEAIKRWPHVQNSLVVSGGAGGVAAILRFLIAHIAPGRNIVGATLLDARALMAAALPGGVLSTGDI